MASSRHAASVPQVYSDKYLLPPGHYLVRPDTAETTVAGLSVPNTKVSRVGTILASAAKSSDYPEYPVGAKMHYLTTNSLELVLNDEPVVVVSWRDVRLVALQ